MIFALFILKYQNNSLNLRRSNENNNGNEPTPQEPKEKGIRKYSYSLNYLRTT